MSRGVGNNTCIISLNRFETTSLGGFGESGLIQIQWLVRTRQNRFEPIPLSQCGPALNQLNQKSVHLAGLTGWRQIHSVVFPFHNKMANCWKRCHSSDG